MKLPVLALLAAFAGSAIATETTMQLQYPETRRTDFKETLHGVEVADPYRWMEDMNSPEVAAWVAAQNKVTSQYLSDIPARDAIRKRYEKLFNFERYESASKVGDKYIWSKNDGLQNQSVLYWAKSLGAKAKVLLDPNKLSKDGTVALSGTAISDDGKWLAYSVSKGGSDWQEWHVRNIDTGKDLKDVISWSKFSGAAFDKDGKGFYYSAYDAPKAGQALAEQNYYQKIYYHKLGTAQSKDVLVYERKDQKEWGFGGEVTDDGKYLVLSVWKGTDRENQIFYKDLQSKNGKVVELLKGFDAQYSFVGNSGPVFFFFTDKNAALGALISIDVRKPDRKNWTTVIPSSKETLVGVNLIGRKFFASYLSDAHSAVRVFSIKGKPEGEVDLPGIGSAGIFDGKSDDTEFFYSYASFGYPSTIFRYNVKTAKSTKVFQPTVDFDPDKFETKQVFYNSKDGTRVPMFLTYKKGLKMDGSNPTLLYAYGGFNISQTPFFSVSRLVWMEMGGISAVACIRGGGEYGKAWHDGGRLKNKQNTFDDFIAAGEWLIDQKYTSTPKLAINGGSNGGLLMGAVMTQRPDLWGAVLCDVGVLDMLRFHKFTIGWAWKSDYGDPDKKEDFDVSIKYSPYHNVKKGTSYPPTLIATGDHDDRVVPLHSFKFASELQWAQSGPNPILIRVETQAGHGAGKPTSKIIEEVADKWAFCVKSLGWKLPAGF
ncbi:MAG: S9 family peptidase [Fimbriimonadaceae bacterium]|nr:S9 family peptidase [Fimbriimonadaceae bacterium]